MLTARRSNEDVADANRRGSTAARARSYGTRARHRATRSASSRSRSIAIAMRCSIASFRTARRVTPARRRASPMSCRWPARKRHRTARTSPKRCWRSRARSPTARANPPEGSYTAQLFAGGIDRIGKKIGEEATEVVIAAKNEDRKRAGLGDERLALPHAGAAGRTRACRSTKSATNSRAALRADPSISSRSQV